MKVHYITAYSIEKNLGKAYNEAMAMIPDGDCACFTDGDSMFLTPDFGHIIHEYATFLKNDVLTCWISRIHELAKGQRYMFSDNKFDHAGVFECLDEANKIKVTREYTKITGSVSGTLLVVPKHIWHRFPFSEVNTYRPNEPNLLGCDNEWTNRIRANGIQVLRMDGVLLYHQYRLLTNSKQHLL